MTLGNVASFDFLSTQEHARLLDVLFDGNLSASAVAKRFRDAFSSPRFVAVCGQLTCLWRQCLRVGDGVALLSMLCVVDAMRKGECAAAVSLFCEMLLDVERVLRRDLLVSEQIKYASKDVKDGSSSNNSGKCGDAAHFDLSRIHMAVKLLGLQLLADATLPSDKLTTLLSRKQEALDQALESWEKTAKQVREQFAHLARTRHATREQQQASLLHAHAAQVEACTTLGAVGVTAPLTTVMPPAMPVQHGELHYFVPGNPTYALCYNAAATTVPEPYRELRCLLMRACDGELNKDAEQDLLQQLSEDAVLHMGIDDDVVRGLAVHSAEVCAAVLSRLPATVASAHIQHLLTSDVRDKVDTILLHAAMSLDQANVRTFVQNKLSAFHGKTTPPLVDKEALRGFALVLHQLLTKAAKDNKQIYLTNDLKRDLEQLFVTSGAPEVVSRWDDMKS